MPLTQGRNRFISIKQMLYLLSCNSTKNLEAYGVSMSSALQELYVKVGDADRRNALN